MLSTWFFCCFLFFPLLEMVKEDVIQAQITLQPNPNAYSKKY